MPHILDPSELDPVATRVLIVNVGTELATTLAIASVRSTLPAARVLVINCDPATSSIVHFQYLADAWDLDLLDRPLRWHGTILDQVIDHLPEDDVYVLLDSDAEIVDSDWVVGTIAAVQQPGVYGTGLLQSGAWIDNMDDVAPETCWWLTKFFTCCVTLRGAAIRSAHQAGVSFEPKTIYNDIASSPALSRLLASRFDDNLILRPAREPRQTRPLLDKLPVSVRGRITGSRLRWLSWARHEYEGHRPNYVYSDTGAEVHAWCTAHGWEFVGPYLPRVKSTGRPPAADQPRSIAGPDGYDVLRWWEPGLTTRLLRGGGDDALTVPGSWLLARLWEGYEIDWATFGVPAWSWPVGLSSRR
jgi:hypothetical protein